MADGVALPKGFTLDPVASPSVPKGFTLDPVEKKGSYLSGAQGLVPDVAEEIGKAIMEAEADDIEYQGGGAYKAMLKLFNENLK